MSIGGGGVCEHRGWRGVSIGGGGECEHRGWRGGEHRECGGGGGG